MMIKTGGFVAPILKIILTLTILLNVFATTINLFRFFKKIDSYPYFSDYSIYLTGSNIIREKGSNYLYHLEVNKYYYSKTILPYTSRDFLPFINLPSTAYMYLPFTYLELAKGYFVFMFINMVAFLLLMFLIYSFRLMPMITIASRKSVKWIAGSFLGFVFLTYLPISTNFFLGQIIIFFTLIILLIYYQLKKDRNFLAGLLSALLLIRPQFIYTIILFFLISKEKRKFLIGVLLSSLALFLVNIAISGLDFIYKYPSYLLSVGQILNSYSDEMFGLLSFLRIIQPFLGINILYILVIYLIIAFTTICYFYTKAESMGLLSDKIELLVATTVIFTIALSPYSFSHDLSLFIIPILILFKFYYVTKKYRYIFVASILFFIPLLYNLGLAILSFIPLLFSGIYLLDDKIFLDREKVFVQEVEKFLYLPVSIFDNLKHKHSEN